jgi:hypothetical protein
MYSLYHEQTSRVLGTVNARELQSLHDQSGWMVHQVIVDSITKPIRHDVRKNSVGQWFNSNAQFYIQTRKCRICQRRDKIDSVR